MKKIITPILALTMAVSAYSQDVIVKNDGSTILSKVLEIGTSEVKYKKFSNQNGPTYNISKTDIQAINYENGEKEDFSTKTEGSKTNTILKSATSSPQGIVLKAGTGIPIRIVTPVRASGLNVGQNVTFQVNRDIVVDGTTLIPYGTPVKGTVYEAKKSSWWGTKGRLGIRIDEIVLPNGIRVPLRDGDIYVTGKNKTALSVILFLFVTIPACAITGTRAEIPAGYEVIASVANNVDFSMTTMQSAITEQRNTEHIDAPIASLLPSFPYEALIQKKNGSDLDVTIQKIENDLIFYTMNNSSSLRIQSIHVSKVRSLRLPIEKTGYTPSLPCEGEISYGNTSAIVTFIALEGNRITYTLKGKSHSDKWDNIEEIRFLIPRSLEMYNCNVYGYQKKGFSLK